MDSRHPRIAIFLCTYNGERFLDEQLASLRDQDVAQIDVFVSDDGSTDRTLEILHAWRTAWAKGSFEVGTGPRQGFAENFRSLLSKSGVTADYIACCDQDDIWDPDKLSVAIAALERSEPERPAVYFSRTRLIDVAGRDIGYSPLFTRPPTFRNAIIQSIGGGNTMVLNRAGFAILSESARRTGFVTHDWWAYMIVSGAGGRVIYDPVPRIGYRQHESNLVGKNSGWGARLTRFSQLLQGRLARWTARNLEGLTACSDLLSDEARTVTKEVSALHDAPPLLGVRPFLSSGIYRQTGVGQLALAVAATAGLV